MSKRIDLATLLNGSGKPRAERAAVFALLSLGVVESLMNGLVSAADAVAMFFHAENCRFVRKDIRTKTADEIMSRGVQLADLFDALPAEQAQREFQRELAKLRELSLKLVGQKRLVA